MFEYSVSTYENGILIDDRKVSATDALSACNLVQAILDPSQSKSNLQYTAQRTFFAKVKVQYQPFYKEFTVTNDPNVKVSLLA